MNQKIAIKIDRSKSLVFFHDFKTIGGFSIQPYTHDLYHYRKRHFTLDYAIANAFEVTILFINVNQNKRDMTTYHTTPFVQRISIDHRL